MAARLALLGAAVHITGRTETRGVAVAAEMTSTAQAAGAGGSVRFHLVDNSRLRSVAESRAATLCRRRWTSW